VREDPVTVLDRALKAGENIERRAKTLTFRQVALTLIAIIPFVIFFVTYFVIIKGVWTVITWLYSAGIEGWETAKTINRKDR